MRNLPDCIEKLEKLKARLESEEKEYQKAKRLKEEIAVLARKKEQRKRWKKIEREQRIRRFFHLPRKTMIESGLFEK